MNDVNAHAAAGHHRLPDHRSLLAFYGTHVMIVLTMISYSMPIHARGSIANSEKAQVVEIGAFWLMTLVRGFTPCSSPPQACCKPGCNA